MDNGILNLQIPTDSSAAISEQKLYSAGELAELYVKSRPDFLGLDMETVTRGWDLNYIYDFLYHVKNLPDIHLIINWLAEKWAEAYHLYDTYTNIKNPKIVEEHQRFVLSLKDIKESLIRRFEAEEHKEELMAQMLMGYTAATTDKTLDDASITTNSNGTISPTFDDSNNSGQAEYHLNDLPEDVRNILNFTDDETYSLFVRNMNEDTWIIVEKNKGKYLDRLRFICNKFSITAKNTDRKKFDKLLHYIIPNLGEIGNLESAMKKQMDSNDDANYKYYDSREFYYRIKCSELCKVGLELEESLTPVLEKLHHKKWNLKSYPR